MHDNQRLEELLLGLSFLENYSGKGSGTHPYKVLKRVFEHACSESASIDEDGTVTFSWRDIQTTADVSDDGRRLKKQLKKGIDEWPSHFEKLNQDAVDNELKHYPTFELIETGGGAGNISRYRIKLHPVSLNTALDKSTLKKGYISYTPERSDSKSPLIRFVDGLTATGFRLHLITGVMLCIIATSIVTLLAGLYLVTSQSSTFGILSVSIDVALIVGTIYLVFSPFYYCVVSRIIIAPTILSPLDHYSSQLEYTPTAEIRDDGTPVRQFRIVSYVGECLICGGRVNVEKGKGPMAGRLVGRCSNSPLEHEYTFDHKSKVGKLTHEEYLDIQVS